MSGFSFWVESIAKGVFAWANILVYCSVVIWVRIEMLTIFCCGDAVMHLLWDTFFFEDLTGFFFNFGF
jgi:hypothetical protein